MSADKPSRWPRWRFAARIARREVRRRPGRTLLVTLLIALPIFGMALGDIAYRTDERRVYDDYQSRYGTSDVAFGDLPGGFDVDTVVAELPEGSQAISYSEIRSLLFQHPVTMITEDDASANVEFSNLPIDDPLTEGIVEIHEGRAPTQPDELFLAEHVADELGASVGDTIALSSPDATYTVVGTGRSPGDFGRPLAIVESFPFEQLSFQADSTVLLISGPDEVRDVSIVRELAGSNEEKNGFETPDSNPQSENGIFVAWASWVLGVLALAALGFVIAAAFATNGRRQLQTLGQLSVNGADQRLLTRTLVLQGSWSGLAGSVVGIGAAVAFLPLLGLSSVESLFGHSIKGWQIHPGDLGIIALTGVVAATIAASIPARSIARVPVLAALAGRRPPSAVPRSTVLKGLVLFLVGVLMIGTSTLAAPLGGIAVMAGVYFMSAPLAAALGPLGRRTAGTAKLAARSLARNRTRTAAVITAIAIAGGVSVVASTAAANEQENESVRGGSEYLAENMVLVSPGATNRRASQTDYDEMRSSVTRILGNDIEMTSLRFLPVRSPRAELAAASSRPVFVADEALLDLLDMSSEDRDRLADAGAMSAKLGGSGDNKRGRTSMSLTKFLESVEVRPGSVDSEALDDFEVVALPENVPGAVKAIVTEELLTTLGIDSNRRGFVAVSPQPLSDEQRDQFSELDSRLGRTDLFSLGPAAREELAGGEPVDPDGLFDFDSSDPDELSADERRAMIEFFTDPPQDFYVKTASGTGSETSDSEIQVVALAVTLLVTLGVVTVALALAAAEGRDERDLLIAVGAKPSSIRRLAGLKAWWMATLGAVLAVPVGFVPTWILMSVRVNISVSFPWLAVLLLVVGVPIIASIVAWAGSSVAQRVKPVTMSTLAVD